MQGKRRKTFSFEGKRYSVSANTQEELYEKLARKKIELEEGKKRISKNMLVSAWAREWVEVYKEPTVGTGWYKNIKTILNSTILPSVGHLRLKDVRPTHLQRILNERSDLSASYLKQISVVIREMFTEAVRNGLLVENPTESLSQPRGRSQRDRRSITDREREALLNFCENHWSGIFFKLQLYCGLRPSEAACVTFNDLTLNSYPPRLKVTKAVKSDGSVGSPKSKAGYREIPVPEELAKELRKTKKGPFDLVCVNSEGNMIKPVSFSNLWKRARYQMNIFLGCKTYYRRLIPPYPLAEDFTMYCLRHTYCTDLEKAGVPISVASRLMGHSSIELTAKIYTHDSEEMILQAAEKINAFVR